MNAKEAREEAIRFNAQQDMTQLTQIRESIKRAVKRGEFEVDCYDGKIRDGVQSVLESDGYHFDVPRSAGMNETSIRIWW